MRIWDRIFGSKNGTFNKGVDAYKQGDFQEAAKFFSKVVKIDPKDYGAFYSLAYSYLMLKDYRKAAMYFKEFQKVAPAEEDSEHFRDLLRVVEQASSVKQEKADKMIRGFLSEDFRKRNEATVGGRKVTSADLVRKVNELLSSEDFRQCQTVKRFSSAMSGKIPLRFYGIRGLENINAEDAFAFGLGFVSGGYAVAKASKEMVASDSYSSYLSQEVVRKLVQYPPEKGIPISYDENLMRVSNPIPWEIVSTVLSLCIETNLSAFLTKTRSARVNRGVVRKHLVRELVYTGYFIGVRENTIEQNC